MKRIFLIFILVSNLFLSNAQNSKINQAFDFFNQKQFSLAQSLFEEIDGETALFYNARCSQELELEDAKELFEKLINDFPFSVHYDAAISCLADIHFSNDDFSESIIYFLNVQTLSDKQRFNLAYSYFQLDSLKTARYNFSKLLDKESDYQSPSKYYYAHISYQLQNYQTSLKWFKELQVDKKFKKIVPYYIAQIYYFLQEYDVLIEYLYPIVDQVVESRKTEVNRLLGEAYYREKDYLNAAKFLKIYADLSTDLKDSERFMLGFSYYQIGDYLLAVDNLDKITLGDDKQSQISSYYLGASYLRLNKNNYALQSFKKASKMNFDIKIKEESLFNYAKLAYEQDLPFENALSIFNEFSLSSASDIKKEHIKSLSVSLLRGTSNYNEAYNSLKSKNSLSDKEKVMLQELTFFLAVQEFNNKNFNDAILFFVESINNPENPRLLSAAEIWLADSYYQLSDYKSAQNIYSKQYILANDFLTSLNTYNKAYTLFKLEQYSQAAKFFRQFVKLSKDSMFLNDSYLRIADCYYMQKDFILAEKYYDKSLVLNLFDVDYALYQRSICFGVMGDDNQRVKLLSELAKNFSNSAYFDDALFLIAEHKKNSNLFSEALLFYDSVLTNTINDNLKAKSHLGKAVIYFNNDKVDNAISEYKFVVENFQNGSYFKEALLGLKAIYVGIAKVDEYISFINTIPKYKISVSEQDSLSYSAAFIKFSEQDFKTASEAFTKYIDEFKEGIFINDAYYYNANSMLSLSDSIGTTKSYKYLVENRVNHYLEEALLYLSRLYFKKEDYLISNAYYSSLDSIASNNSIKRESCVRLMYGYEYIDSKKAMEYAIKVLQFDKIDNWLVSKAKIIISRYDFELGNYFKAKNIFREIVELDKNSEGAEAMYNLIYLTYLDDSLSLAEKLIFEMPNEFSDDFYIAKSFILLSDIYLKQNNKFQAKATLESIIENYSGQDLKIIAQKKREEIIESEIVIEKNEIDTYYMDIFEDDLEYELITDTLNKINTLKVKNKYIVFLLFFVVTDALAQDLKTTEINVVEGLKVSVPQPDKLNVKATFLDTTKVDKTQEYSFINKYIFSTFETRPLSAAKIKRKSELKSNYGNVNVSFGNRAFKFGNFNYSGKLKDKLIYGLGLLFDTYDYQTGNDNTKVSKDNFEFYVRTKRIFEKGILNSRLTFKDISEFHGFSINESPAKTYSEILASYSSRTNADDKIKHSSQLLIKDFNNQIENQIGLYSDLSSTINNIPFDLSFEYNNYLNYINHDPSIIVDEIDVKILDITPNFSFDKFGFSLNLGFNLGIEIEPEKSVDVFPIIEVNKELVDNVVNLSFGIDRDDYRNTLSSLTFENPYVHTPAISTGVEDSIGYFHKLETTDIYECFLNLDNKLSANEFLTLNIGYGKLLNLHYFDFDQTTSLNRFNVNYIDTWRFRSKIMYQRKFTNVLSFNLDAQYNWYNEEIPHKTNLEANLSLPIVFRDKLKFIPSIKYIGERKYSYMSGLFISPPEIVFDNLDDQYLVNLNIHYSYTEKLDFSIGVNNILDVQKPYWSGYDQIGLNFNFAINYIL